MEKTLMFILGVLLLYYTGELDAQLRTDKQVRRGRFVSQFSYQSWVRSSDEEVPPRFQADVRQIATPFFLSVPIFNRVQLRVTQTGARSTLTNKDGHHLNGLGNTDIKVAYRTANNRFVLTGGIGLPIGDRISTSTKREVSKGLVSDLWNFRVVRYGEALSAHAAADWGNRFGKITLFTGVSYTHRLSYETVITGDEPKTWDSPNEIRFRGQLIWRNGPFVWRGHTTMSRLFGGDLEDMVGVTGRLTANNTLGFEGRMFGLSLVTHASYTMATSIYTWPRTVLGGRVIGRYPLTFNSSIHGLIEARHIPDDEALVSNGWLYTFGGGIRLPIRKGIRLDVELKYAAGQEDILTEAIDREVASPPEVNLRGFGLSTMLVSSF